MTSPADILTSLDSQVSTTLGATWTELQYIYDLERNPADTDKRYGVGAGSGGSGPGVNKAVTMNFDFFVVLAKRFINSDDDVRQRAVLSEIYEEFETLDINIFQKKLNNANVLLVSDLNYEDPEIIGKQTMSVRVNFTIKYRNQTT